MQEIPNPIVTPFRLSHDDRAAFLADFEPPFRWSRLNCGECLRFWHVIHMEPGRILLQHGTGAVAILTRQDDLVSRVELVEGEAAEPHLRNHAFQVGDDLRERFRRALTVGRPAYAAMKAAATPSSGVTALDRIVEPDGKERWRYRASWGGVLEVRVDTDGAVLGHRWHTGGEALDLLIAHQTARFWEVPCFPGKPVEARTPAEVRLFVAVLRGTVLASRDRTGLLEVLTQLPEGRRRLFFRVERPEVAGRHQLGTGTSRALDPADLLLFAARVERELPAEPAEALPERREYHHDILLLAAAGLRQAARFIPEDQDLPPLGVYHTRAGELLRMTRPDRFRREVLLADADRLEVLAGRWRTC